MAGKDNKTGPGPRREELSVGLARKAVSESTLVPRWFVEFGGWIFAGGLLLGALVTLGVLKDRNEQDRLLMKGAPASLVVIGTPLKVWEEGSGTKVKSVQVRVGNQGAHPAENVRVFVVSRSSRDLLRGPERIESGKSAVFSGDTQLVLRQDQEVQLVLECSNCR